MTQQQTYDELKAMAEQIGLQVRSEIGEFDGGVCTVRDKRVLLLNKRHPVARRISVLARALATADLGGIFVKPALRDLIDEELAMMALESRNSNATPGVAPPAPQQ